MAETVLWYALAAFVGALIGFALGFAACAMFAINGVSDE